MGDITVVVTPSSYKSVDFEVRCKVAASNFVIKVFTPNGLILEDFSCGAKVPSVEGEIQFLPQHAKYIGILSTGILEYESHPLKNITKMVVSEGLCFFENDTLIILADNAVHETSGINVSKLDTEIAELEKKLVDASLYDVETICGNKRLAYIKTLKSFIAE